MSRADGMTHFMMDDEVQGKMERAEEGKRRVESIRELTESDVLWSRCFFF